MFAELGVSGLPSKVMMASLIKLCITGSEYGLKRGCLKMHSTIWLQFIAKHHNVERFRSALSCVNPDEPESQRQILACDTRYY